MKELKGVKGFTSTKEISARIQKANKMKMLASDIQVKIHSQKYTPKTTKFSGPNKFKFGD